MGGLTELIFWLLLLAGFFPFRQGCDWAVLRVSRWESPGAAGNAGGRGNAKLAKFAMLCFPPPPPDGQMVRRSPKGFVLLSSFLIRVD